MGKPVCVCVCVTQACFLGGDSCLCSTWHPTPHRVANLKQNFGRILSCKLGPGDCGHVPAQGPIEGSPPTWSPGRAGQTVAPGTRLSAPLASVTKLEALGDSCSLSLGEQLGQITSLLPSLLPLLRWVLYLELSGAQALLGKA